MQLFVPKNCGALALFGMHFNDDGTIIKVGSGLTPASLRPAR
jgi:hypothetical protein